MEKKPEKEVVEVPQKLIEDILELKENMNKNEHNLLKKFYTESNKLLNAKEFIEMIDLEEENKGIKYISYLNFIFVKKDNEEFTYNNFLELSNKYDTEFESNNKITESEFEEICINLNYDKNIVDRFTELPKA